MQLTEGTSVYSGDNKEVGRITHIVFDPLTKKVTHIVVREGWIFTEDKVVPIEMIGGQDAERVTLDQNADELEALPKFEEPYYVPADLTPEATVGVPINSFGGLYMYPPVGAFTYDSGLAGGLYPPEHRYVQSSRQNIPEDTVALKEGARVISADDEHVGHIESVIVEKDTDYATHIVISQGLILKTRKVVPTAWLRSVDEDDVYLAVSTALLKNLPAY